MLWVYGNYIYVYNNSAGIDIMDVIIESKVDHFQIQMTKNIKLSNWLNSILLTYIFVFFFGAFYSVRI